MITCKKLQMAWVCLFVLILYVPVNNFLVMLGWVFLGWTSTKQRIKCLDQGHNAVPLERLEPTTPQSPVKHSSTQPPHSFYPLAEISLFHISDIHHFHAKNKINVPRNEISNNVVCATSKISDQHAHTCSLIRAFASRLNILWVLSY